MVGSDFCLTHVLVSPGLLVQVRPTHHGGKGYVVRQCVRKAEMGDSWGEMGKEGPLGRRERRVSS